VLRQLEQRPVVGLVEWREAGLGLLARGVDLQIDTQRRRGVAVRERLVECVGCLLRVERLDEVEVGYG
jgi:hypothetical protein